MSWYFKFVRKDEEIKYSGWYSVFLIHYTIRLCCVELHILFCCFHVFFLLQTFSSLSHISYLLSIYLLRLFFHSFFSPFLMLSVSTLYVPFELSLRFTFQKAIWHWWRNALKLILLKNFLFLIFLLLFSLFCSSG